MLLNVIFDRVDCSDSRPVLCVFIQMRAELVVGYAKIICF